ncbi:uncharacterized protein, partial [Penaeus vannamei]|uniref:uncharacterized protein n=1 Tax=Penaeus vannamei TaxID=6689 RepID=UPI00387FA838
MRARSMRRGLWTALAILTLTSAGAKGDDQDDGPTLFDVTGVDYEKILSNSTEGETKVISTSGTIVMGANKTIISTSIASNEGFKNILVEKNGDITVSSVTTIDKKGHVKKEIY